MILSIALQLLPRTGGLVGGLTGGLTGPVGGFTGGLTGPVGGLIGSVVGFGCGLEISGFFHPIGSQYSHLFFESVV
jgi:hypothetical protein